MRTCLINETLLNTNKCTRALKSFYLALLAHSFTTFQSNRTRDGSMV